MALPTDPARICADLVRIRSENPPGDTTEVATYIREHLDALGIGSRVIRKPGGRESLVSPDPVAGLLFCGHLDVVPVGEGEWSVDPFGGEIRDGMLYGRGASDMKGGCAAILSAVGTLVEAGREPRVSLAFVADEETGGKLGIRAVLDAGLIPPGDCLVAEPTPPLHPLIGQKGLLRLAIRFRGRPGHGSLYPRVGVSAVMEALSLLGHLKKAHDKVYPPPAVLRESVEVSAEVLGGIFGIPDPGAVLQRITYNPGRIEGGEKANVVAARCSLELELRIPFGASTGRVLASLRARAKGAEVEVLSRSEPNFTSPDVPLIGILSREIRRVHGGEPRPIVQWAASDAKHLRPAGFRVVEYGPGDLTTLHAVDERVPVRALEQAAEVYRGVISVYQG
ncbi:MAG: ArgE/DapE family deacylase [Methanomicrobiales archaeon]|nr:ArgE/DapE family deacylase [Methanomicrobiales archaeon]MDD1660731.1 ArgE/DapE family deacylase [Methanomicrobiales archaeon]